MLYLSRHLCLAFKGQESAFFVYSGILKFHQAFQDGPKPLSACVTFYCIPSAYLCFILGRGGGSYGQSLERARVHVLLRAWLYFLFFPDDNKPEILLVSREGRQGRVK